MTNQEFIIAGIKNLLKRNYGIDTETIDVFAHVDSTLTFGENWSHIKEMVVMNRITFSYLTCKSCEQKIKDNWNYCPICGERL